MASVPLLWLGARPPAPRLGVPARDKRPPPAPEGSEPLPVIGELAVVAVVGTGVVPRNTEPARGRPSGVLVPPLGSVSASPERSSDA